MHGEPGAGGMMHGRTGAGGTIGLLQECGDRTIGPPMNSLNGDFGDCNSVIGTAGEV